MSTPFKVILFGIILIIVGAIVAALSFGSVLRDPSEESKATLEFEGSSYYGIPSESAYLEEGDYDIWYPTDEYDWIDTGDPGNVRIEDSNGGTISLDDSSGTETITINDQSYEKAGSFKIENSGQYTFTVSNECTLYITPEIDVGTTLGLCFVGVIIGVVGGIVLFIGIILIFTRKKKKKYPGYPPPQPTSQSTPAPNYQSPSPPQPPPPPGHQSYPPPPGYPPPQQQPPPPGFQPYPPPSGYPPPPQQPPPQPPPKYLKPSQ